MSRQVTAGPRVVITRSKEGNRSLAHKLRARGITPVMFNTLSFRPPEDWRVVDGQLGNLADFDWVIFTSATGVKFFVERMKRLGLSVKSNRQRPRIAAVGARTASALRRRNLRVDFVPKEYLTSVLGREIPEVFGRKVLLLRASIASQELSATLKKRGFQVTEVTIYKTSYEYPAIHPDGLLKSDLIAFTSPSVVKGFCEAVPEKILAVMKQRIPAVCIGPVTGKAAVESGFRVMPFPKEHTIAGLVEEIGRFAADA